MAETKFLRIEDYHIPVLVSGLLLAPLVISCQLRLKIFIAPVRSTVCAG